MLLLFVLLLLLLVLFVLSRKLCAFAFWGWYVTKRSLCWSTTRNRCLLQLLLRLRLLQLVLVLVLLNTV